MTLIINRFAHTQCGSLRHFSLEKLTKIGRNLYWCYQFIISRLVDLACQSLFNTFLWLKLWFQRQCVKGGWLLSEPCRSSSDCTQFGGMQTKWSKCEYHSIYRTKYSESFWKMKNDQIILIFIGTAECVSRDVDNYILIINKCLKPA